MKFLSVLSQVVFLSLIALVLAVYHLPAMAQTRRYVRVLELTASIPSTYQPNRRLSPEDPSFERDMLRGVLATKKICGPLNHEIKVLRRTENPWNPGNKSQWVGKDLWGFASVERGYSNMAVKYNVFMREFRSTSSVAGNFPPHLPETLDALGD